MATKPNENWQERVYEAFTSNVKLDINNPQEGLSGPIERYQKTFQETLQYMTLTSF